jgi:phytoene dehydrogenase-like protein
MTATNAPSVLVVGGGLSGIVLSHELVSRGWKVTLLERSGRLGGKAGSELRNGRLVEHAH